MRALWLAGLLLTGCATFDPRHPLVGRPEAPPTTPAIVVWSENRIWHVRLYGAGHRFQGSVGPVDRRRRVTALAITEPELSETVALARRAVQFDVAPGAAPPTDGDAPGFDVRVEGECARFDLYVDGRRRPERIRLGPRLTRPARLPFDRCP